MDDDTDTDEKPTWRGMPNEVSMWAQRTCGVAHMISHDVSWIVDPRCAYSEDSGSGAQCLLFKVWGNMKHEGFGES